MKRSRRVLVTLAVTLLVVLVTLQQLPAITAYLLERKLNQLGMSDTNITIRQLDSRRAHIDTLRLNYPAASFNLHAIAESLQVEYTLTGLLAGKLEKLEIDELRLNAEPRAAITDSRLVLPGLTAGWATRSPIEQLQIHNITAKAPSPYTPNTMLAITGKITKLPGETLRAELHLGGEKRSELDVLLSIADDGTITTRVVEPTTGNDALSAQLTQLQVTSNRLTAGIDFTTNLSDMNAMTGWLPALPGSLRAGNCELHGNLGFDASNLQFTLTADTVLLQELLQFNGAFELASTTERISIQLSPATRLAIQNTDTFDINIPQLALSLSEPLACSSSTGLATWQCGASAATLSAPLANHADSSLTSKAGIIRLKQLQIDPQDWHASAELDLTSPVIRTAGTRVHLDALQLGIVANSKRLDIESKISAAAGVVMQVKAEHDSREQRGKASFTLKAADFQPGKKSLAAVLDPLPYPLQLDSGRMSARGNVQWQYRGKQYRLSQLTNLRLDNLTGQIQNIPFSGLSADLQIKGIETIDVSSKTPITLAMFNPGVAITDTELLATLRQRKGKQAEIGIRRFNSKLLGGSVSLADAEVDFNRAQNPLLLKIDGVDVASLIALEQKPGLTGSGTLNGSLPLLLGSDGLRMTEGKLYAVAPGGVIRYSGDERLADLARDNPGIDLLLQALRDFHYRLLEADLDYAPDGQLLAKLRIEGNNPELQGGKPVHLNINLEENIRTLLRSLQLADEISTRIGENIEHGGKRP